MAKEKQVQARLLEVTTFFFASVKMPYVYVLALEGNRFYCGSTRSPIEERLQAHWTQKGFGARWTEAHKPVPVLSCVQVAGCPILLERATTAALMLQHGWERVRGGPWCRMDQKPPGWWDPECSLLVKKYGPRMGECLGKRGEQAAVPNPFRGVQESEFERHLRNYRGAPGSKL